MKLTSMRHIQDPLLRKLATSLGSTTQAYNEMRWIKQEVPACDVNHACLLRAKGYPLQYILGSQPFGPLDIKCRPGVLIPRWETEEWATKLGGYVDSSQQFRILDIGSGSGCVLFLLLSILPNAKGVGLDISKEAIELFKINQSQLQLMDRAQVLEHDLHQRLPSLGPIDIIVSNPPYIPNLSDADLDVQRHEPTLALVEQPLVYEHLVQRVLESSAKLSVFEVGSLEQINRCISLFEAANWQAWGERDTAHNWRTIWALSPQSKQDI